MASHCRKGGLGRPMTPPPKQAPDREPETASQIVGLIEPAAQGAQWVEWHGHHCVSPVQHRAARPEHQVSQRFG